ncbi:HNH endonuclease [Leptospira interrogans]|uniref:HNH endonuclease n=1 Tax=Leptospira interrogans TaxID=173 RepID=UPI001F079198|nr:HNH endonuclease signature motif containing protein [Leptospira interrogans]UML84036.1 HNH endonuclease [Leptospira interrogans]
MSSFLTKIKRIYRTSKSKISYRWKELYAIYAREPKIFENIFNRCTGSRYESEENLLVISLWTASNITAGYLHSPFCYYCGLPFNHADYFNGTVHLDHFNPISLTGKHQAGNILPACKDCNQLKSNLSDNELLTIFYTPEKFFSQRYKKSTDSRKAKLKDFSALFFQKQGGEEYRNFFNLTIFDQSMHQEEMKLNYRAKWFGD